MLTLATAGSVLRRAPQAARRRLQSWSSRQWCHYFHRQWHRLLKIPWRQGANLTPAERDRIVASLRVRRWRWLLALSHGVDRLIFVAAALTVWLGHRRVLRAGKFGFWTYVRQARQAFHSIARLKDPRNYQSL
jgi:hypothetical protein